MKEVINALVSLLKIKSIVTIVCTIVFACLALNGVISGQQFLEVFLVIVTFYFSSQTNKDK